MAIIRELIAVAVFVAGFGSEAFCQVQALDAEVYREGIREATEASRGDYYVVVLSSEYDDDPLFRIPREFDEELNPISTVPFRLRIRLRPIYQRFAWSLALDLAE